ncbi:MAG: 7-cyano-7-deazaguanine synthase QueC [Chlamydiota bacterium]|nr:7-cyano-7-deazaguanine synthase QueC [Chlamydiota bacterium]
MKAIILMSGGIDSTVTLALALDKGYDCLALSFDYGQRHLIELTSARAICKHYDVPHHTIKIDPSAFGMSSLVEKDSPMPKERSLKEISEGGIPNTYVPARNTIFLSFALGQAEIFNADEIHFGMNAHDISAYPDCRPEYINAFQSLIDVATKQSLEKSPPKIVTPLTKMTKGDIITTGYRLAAPIELTHSCYNPTKNDLQCGVCDACALRKEGFATAQSS